MTIPFEALKEKYLVAIWAWELNRFTGPWQANFDFVDEVWVGSRYTQDVVAHVSPIPVVRMPFAIEVSASKDVKRAQFGLPDDRFIFLYSFSTTSTAARKNPFGFIEAFKRAFGTPKNSNTKDGDTKNAKNKKAPLLVLKAHHLDSPDAKLLTPALREAVESVGGILFEENLSRQAMYDLLSTADCFVSLHRAEGFGLLIAESMALGKPVIATAYSGNMDYMTPTNSYGVPYSIRTIATEDHRYQPRLEAIYGLGYEWADPDIDCAAALMTQVYENQDEARKVGQQAARDIGTYYNRNVIGQRILERFQAICRKGDDSTALT
jgi:glycosyltransferase involved in cell wall biosynthesis